NKTHALGRSVGGFTTKIHALTDALGNPVRFILTAGNIHDIVPSQELLHGIKDSYVIADKAYFSDENVRFLKENGNTVVIPARENYTKDHSVDWHIYKERHLIENFFSIIKHFRRVFSRFDKTCSAFLGFIALASTFIW
ncbi:IS5 family transposase, partial [Francisella sp. W12-1067]